MVKANEVSCDWITNLAASIIMNAIPNDKTRSMIILMREGVLILSTPWNDGSEES